MPQYVVAREPGPVEVEDLLEEIRSGNRDAAARFLEAYGPLIRRRYRQKLSRAMRRLFDSQELLSTIARRFDRVVACNGVEAMDTRQLWALIFRIGDNALADKGRVMSRLRRVEGPDAEIARLMRTRLAEADTGEEGFEFRLDEAFRSLSPGTDREILSLWLTDHSHGQIAQHLDLSPAAVRKRWERIRARLRDHLQDESH